MTKYFISLMCILLIGFHMSGQVIIEKTEHFNTEALSSTKLILINPSIKTYTITDDVDEEYMKYPENEKAFFNAMENAFDKLKKLNCETISSKNKSAINIDYFNHLLKLQDNILFANSFQDHPFNSGKNMFIPKYQEKVFVQTPMLSPTFSDIIQKFGTKYFVVYGIISVDASKRKIGIKTQFDSFAKYGKTSLSYLIVTNIETGEIIYREYKKLPFKMKRKYLQAVVFDSFYLLNKKIQ